MAKLETKERSDQLVLTRDLRTAGARVAFFTGVRRGEFTRVIRGVYTSTAAWSSLDRHAQYRTKVMAVAALFAEPPVFSHHSAAALWRLPMVGSWPSQVHVVAPLAAGGRSSGMLIRHTVGIPSDVERIDGLSVTSLARTVVDLARVGSFTQAVAIADAALRRTAHPLHGVPRVVLTASDLARALDDVPLRHGTAKAREVIEFADAAADRPGESVSRVSMHAAGVTMPQLQVPMKGASGRVYFTACADGPGT